MKPDERFTDRVEDYIRYRPGYPPQVVDVLERQYGLARGSVVADIGCGTGLLAELFLEHGYHVVGIEPNDRMREAGEKRLQRFDGFRMVNGHAEATTLDDSRVDLVVAGQAFHWFDRSEAATEFRRILKPPGLVALVWNDRKQSTPFEVYYEQLIRRHAVDYEQVSHRRLTPEAIRDALSVDAIELYKFEHEQRLTREGLLGRARSSSYFPTPDHPTFEKFIADLNGLFDLYKSSDRVTLGYDAVVIVARMNPDRESRGAQ